MNSEKTSISTYFSQVDGSKLLKKQEEIQLAKIMDAGRWHDSEGNLNPEKLWDLSKDKDTLRRAKKARERLISSNLRLVASVAKNYQNKGCEFEDLIQEGNVGLMDGIDRFDYRKEFKISTYCTWWIKQRIDRLISNTGRTVRFPVHVQCLATKLKKIIEDYNNEFGCTPSVPEMAAALGSTEDMAKAAWQFLVPNNTITMDQNPSSSEEGDETLHSYIEDENAVSPLDAVSHKEIVGIVKEVIKTLPPRDEKILRLRFGILEDDKDHESWPITEEEMKVLEERKNGRE